MSKKSALVVIDVQVNVVKDAFNRDQVLDNIRTLLARARASGTPVIPVQYESRPGYGLEAGTPDGRFIRLSHRFKESWWCRNTLATPFT
jgi:nicotinamidase-related amidase